MFTALFTTLARMGELAYLYNLKAAAGHEVRFVLTPGPIVCAVCFYEGTIGAGKPLAWANVDTATGVVSSELGIAEFEAMIRRAA